jgi:hypothetical protein
MAGYAIIVVPDHSPQVREYDFQIMLQLTAEFNQLDLPASKPLKDAAQPLCFMLPHSFTEISSGMSELDYGYWQ